MNFFKYTFFAIIIIFSSCASPKAFVFKGMKSINVEKASFGKNVFKANFEYNNPNRFALTLQKLDCDVFINDQPFTKYHLDSVYHIPANADFQLPARMEVELANIMKHSIDILFNKPMKISVKGNATLTKGFFTKNVPIEFTTQQRLNLKDVLKGTN